MATPKASGQETKANRVPWRCARVTSHPVVPVRARPPQARGGGRSSRDLVRGSCLSPPPPHFCPGGVGTLECTGFEVLVALVAHGIPRPSTRRPAPAVASLINYHLPWWGLAAPIPLWRRHCLLSGPATSPTARPAAISPTTTLAWIVRSFLSCSTWFTLVLLRFAKIHR